MYSKSEWKEVILHVKIETLWNSNLHETLCRGPGATFSFGFLFFSNFFSYCLKCFFLFIKMFIICLVIYGTVWVPHVFRIKSIKQDTYRPVSRTRKAVSQTHQSIWRNTFRPMKICERWVRKVIKNYLKNTQKW